MDFIKRYQNWLIGAIVVLSIGYALLLAPPSDFPVGQTLVVTHGESVSDIAEALSDAHIIQHPSILRLALRISGASAHVQEGTYLFDSRENVITVAYRLATGDYHLKPEYITFPEGVTVKDIAEKVAAALPGVSAASIIATGTPQEGYLFPDTYLFPPGATADSIVETMRANFTVKTVALMPDVASSGHSLADIVTMASIIEKEAQTETDKKIVAGILWNRLARGMALQVDADPETYRQKGLPPAPICNPGLVSIEAALYPTTTNYVYYLSDHSGVIHYATTYAEQQANEAKYLH